MSDLQSILSDLSQPLESTLSFLFNTGDSGDPFQGRILQYLNVWDAMNLRLVNRRLDQIVRGVPVWQTHGLHGNLVYTHNRPANLTNSTTYNSTLVRLGARCNGLHLPGLIPCQTGPQTNLQVMHCTRIPPPLNPNPPQGPPCRGEVCSMCVLSAATHWAPLETLTISRNTRTELCEQCQLYEARRHPYGYSNCSCPLPRAGWLCSSCRHGAVLQRIARGNRKRVLISQLHRDRQGRKTLGPSRQFASKLPCPGCARSFVDRRLQAPHVTYCMSCDGVVVQPSLGPSYLPTALMPVQPRKWSGRIAQKYAAMPPLDFKVPRRG